MDCLALLDERIGGENIVIEIDESLFYKRKYNRGRLLGSGWIFGGVERGNHGNSFLVLVQDRTADTLIPIIQRKIRPGSTIVSDMWKGYDQLSQLGYNHLKINHSENFVNPFERTAHTQNIENFWRWAKRRFRSTTKNNSKRMTRLGEHIFRKKFPDIIFTKILNEIKLSYPAN